jgi:hypothetical protein
MRKDVNKFVDCFFCYMARIPHDSHALVNSGPHPNLASVLQSNHHYSVPEVSRNSLSIRHRLHEAE